MNKVTCPYCGTEQREPDEAYEEEVWHEVDCEKCEKVFLVSPYYIKGYPEKKAPCLNGEPHDWRPIVGYPKEYFENKKRCSHCGLERNIKEEVPDEPRARS